MTVDAPIDGLPLFVKAGSIIPVMDPRIQTLNSATNQSVITMKSLEVWIITNRDIIDFIAHTWNVATTFDITDYYPGCDELQCIYNI